MLALSIPLFNHVVFELPVSHLAGVLLRVVLVANVDKTGLCVGYSLLPLSLLARDTALQPHHVATDIYTSHFYALHFYLHVLVGTRNLAQLRLWLVRRDLQLKISTKLFVVRQSLDLFHIE